MHTRLLAISAVGLLAGCTCGKEKAPAADPPEVVAPIEKPLEAPAPKQARREELQLSPIAVAVQLDDKVFLWTDGRSSAIGQRLDAVKWSPAGFEYAEGQGIKVLAPGGGLYWKQAPSPDARPISGLLQADATPPEGYKLNSRMGRGDKYKISLSGPDNRRVRVGRASAPPTAVAWLEGVLPTGAQVSPELQRNAGWQLGDDGLPLDQPPKGAQAIPTQAPAAVSTWTTALAGLRGAPVSAHWSASADLDRDGVDEGVLCVTGGKGNYGCYLVDTVDGQDRYYGLNIPWKGGQDAPVAFSVDGAPYLAWVGPVNDAPDAARVVAVVRFDGATWRTDTINVR